MKICEYFSGNLSFGEHIPFEKTGDHQSKLDVYMVVFFSVPNCDVITHKKTEDLEYLWLNGEVGPKTFIV